MHCGKDFPLPTTKIVSTASQQELIKMDTPVVEVFKVDHVTYGKHSKAGAPPMIKVSYYCGLRTFNEFVCIEHTGFPRRKATLWWKERATESMQYAPERTDDALVLVPQLKAPTHLRIWVNKQYPEIMAACFDGTAFGTQEPSAPPAVQVHAPRTTVPVKDEFGNVVRVMVSDDDIPF